MEYYAVLPQFFKNTEYTLCLFTSDSTFHYIYSLRIIRVENGHQICDICSKRVSIETSLTRHLERRNQEMVTYHVLFCPV